MEKKHRKSKEAGIATKTDSDFKLQNRQPQIMVQPRPVQKSGILNDKDRQILDDVQNIIWDPARLNKFKNDGNPPAAGLSKKKPAK